MGAVMDVVGLSHSDFDRKSESKASWSMQHRIAGAPWSNYLLSRYGHGYTVTGIAASTALPRLLRRRMQDWTVESFSFYIGPDFVSFGRELHSVSREGSTMFYGVDIRIADCLSDWWYCKPNEWQLQLHKAFLEPVPDGSSQSTEGVEDSVRFPGRAYYLGDEPPPAAVAANLRSGLWSEDSKKDPEARGGPQAATLQQTRAADHVSHQLSIFLGNADGHVGVLSFPVPANQVDPVAAMIAAWEDGLEAPCHWAGRQWRTQEDFTQLRETSVNLPDILLLALEPDLAMSLTPDRTWEKYPQGLGEVTKPSDVPSEGDEGPASQPDAEAAEAVTSEATEQNSAP